VGKPRGICAGRETTGEEGHVQQDKFTNCITTIYRAFAVIYHTYYINTTYHGRMSIEMKVLIRKLETLQLCCGSSCPYDVFSKGGGNLSARKERGQIFSTPPTILVSSPELYTDQAFASAPLYSALTSMPIL
jgi:hypothetical protein